MYPRSGIRSEGTCERTLVPVFVPGNIPMYPRSGFRFPGEHPPKTLFWKTTLVSTPERRELGWIGAEGEMGEAEWG